jgi:broad specificity phosphatase PhoE
VKSLTLLRHADYTADGHLSEKGLMQAQIVAEKFKSWPLIDVAITSNMPRAIETLRIILDTIGSGLKIYETKKLHLPLEKNATWDIETLLNKHQPPQETLQKHPAYSFRVAIQEAFDEIKQIIHQEHSNHALIVAHAHVINAIGLLFDPSALCLEDRHFSHAEGFRLLFEEKKTKLEFIDCK